VVVCLDRGADLHMAQLMPLPLTVSCFSEIQTGFTFLVSAHPGSPGKRAVKRVCVLLTYLHIYCNQKTRSLSRNVLTRVCLFVSRITRTELSIFPCEFDDVERYIQQLKTFKNNKNENANKVNGAINKTTHNKF